MSRARGKPKVTRKHIARAERDQVMTRWILGITIALGVVVAGLLAFAFFGVGYVEARKPIATVNGEVITIRDFKARVRLLQMSVLNEYQYAQTLLQIYASDATMSSYYQQRIQQLEEELGNPLLQGQRAMEGLVTQNLVRQEANARGIYVTRAEVDEAAAMSDFNYYINGTPTPQPTATTDPAAQATTTAGAAPQEADDATPTSSPTPWPTATAYTEEAFQANYAEQMEFFADLDITEADYLSLTEARLYAEKLTDDLRQGLPEEEDMVFIRHILLATPEEGDIVLERLDAGEAWEDIAVVMSLDGMTSDSGGYLGWLTYGDLMSAYGEEFADLSFEAEIEEVIGPLETVYGWHMLQVVMHEVRELTESDVNRVVQFRFEELLSTLEEQGDIEIDENWQEYIPSISGL
jgi:parvulin-like peptidyl-prolyl isomerase